MLLNVFTDLHGKYVNYTLYLSHIIGILWLLETKYFREFNAVQPNVFEILHFLWHFIYILRFGYFQYVIFQVITECIIDVTHAFTLSKSAMTISIINSTDTTSQSIRFSYYIFIINICNVSANIMTQNKFLYDQRIFILIGIQRLIFRYFLWLYHLNVERFGWLIFKIKDEFSFEFIWRTVKIHKCVKWKLLSIQQMETHLTGIFLWLIDWIVGEIYL